MLDNLAERALAVAGGAPLTRPRVVLMLHSGASLHGEVTEVTRDNGAIVIALRLEAQHPTSSDTAFVPLGAIEALLIRDFSEVDKRTSGVPAPGKLELRRAFTTAQEVWNARGLTFAVEIPNDLDDETAREALLEVLRHLETAINAVASDEMGRAALEKLATLRFEIAGKSAVTKLGDALMVSVPLNFAQRPNARGWRDLLEAQL
jgi:hypothetical protein